MESIFFHRFFSLNTFGCLFFVFCFEYYNDKKDIEYIGSIIVSVCVIIIKHFRLSHYIHHSWTSILICNYFFFPFYTIVCDIPSFVLYKVKMISFNHLWYIEYFYIDKMTIIDGQDFVFFIQNKYLDLFQND